ncbi:helix-turn-helix and ligand-binding sensor domain-containing protein [Winogradskyella aquimaris]|uniref:Triple tyrosine motif-containing protein n=1 Tax=Winogradskyella aquimaris TaxID=864074 RepID=A0ABU5EI89_9FLAO|nr:triple tyrosine motif-containing protein [Winogradskyella aquimaris]MDY2585803.1 triple tyrosine motif-containing protein [Winogradskyella aquimaris]
MNILKNFFLCFVFILSASMFGQEIPPIQTFSPQDYQAEDQNWDISQDKNGITYFANNKGLLLYNSARWELFPTPNQSILRSVKVINERIYTGCYMDFGYWEKDSLGNLKYNSLIKNREIDIKEDEEFWDIIEIDNYILFQSLDRIYIYNVENDSFKIIDSENRINKIFRVDDTIFFQKNKYGLYEIQNGVEHLFITSEELNDNEIINIYRMDRSLLLVTKERGIYSYSDGVLSPWNSTVNEILNGFSIYSSIRLKDGSFLFGTISQGIIQISANGKLILSASQSDGLSNNTVLSLHEGINGNVWLGLDNGINCINIDSAYRVYKDKQGVLGTIYASIKVNDYIYLGTNQGLFYKKVTTKSRFNFVEGTKGQVWSLKYFYGTVFCGHDKGTFIIKDNEAKLIKGEIGTWTLDSIEGRPNSLIQGNYKGLSIIEFKNDQWSYRNKIEGFNISSRYFEFIDANELLVSHEYKGVYKVRIDDGYQKVVDSEKLDIQNGAKSSVKKYQGRVLYSNKEGVYVFDNAESKFKKDEGLSELISGDNYVSGKLIYDDLTNRLWLFSKNSIIFIEPGALSAKPKINTIPIPYYLRNSKVGYENILSLNRNEFLIGTTDGYLIVNIGAIQHDAKSIKIDQVSNNSLYYKSAQLRLDQSPQLANKNNNIVFKYSIVDYSSFSATKYQYRLLGIYDNWSDWSAESEAYFENLPHGDYKFEVKAYSAGVESSNIASYHFSIEKPWYLRPVAIGTYIIVGLLLLIGIQYFNSRYYQLQKQKLIEKKQRELELEQLENQRQLIQFKNQNLQLDIENKNRELGTATMNLVKRNELLNNIKDALSKSKSLDDVRGVIKLINTNLNNTSDWKLFEEAFNNVDKDFMKRIKTLHPTITPNDLRLCAYLRLNLSSKEIAPLLNISHKSVEVKRYRLRKKMGLDHEQSLTDYILEL